MPHLEQSALFARYDRAAEPMSPSNFRVIERPVRVFQCPAATDVGHPDGLAESNRSANAEVFNVGTFAGVSDGATNTALLFDYRNVVPEPGELSLVRAWGLGPVDDTLLPEFSPHPAVLVLGTVAGGVRALRANVPDAILGALVTPAGGEVIPGDW